MKKNIFILSVIFLITSVFVLGCSKSKSLDKQLDELEKIIIRYEPKFEKTEYASKEYSEMIIVYNKEIFDWAEVFERDRYQRDENGKMLFDIAKQPLVNPEFKKVEKRFYDLNDRMTRMVLAKIPKPDMPVNTSSPSEPVTEQPGK